MFGFSIQKLIVLAAVIAAVWYGFKFVGRLEQSRKDAAKAAAKPASGAAKTAKTAGPGDAEDMVSCPVCGDYVAAVGAGPCDRADCPHRT